MSRSDDTAGWRFTGAGRPPFAVVPGPGQESVWDYPRPPRLVPDTRLVEVRIGARLVASTTRAIRVLETASPPTFYVPLADVVASAVTPAEGQSWCEWKGRARYWSVVTTDGLVPRCAWQYPDPAPAFAPIADALAFYPARLECFVDGERVRPQAGGFYGGWVTHEIVGPFKGEPGTGGW